MLTPTDTTRRVLVIDDDQDDFTIVSGLLREAGIEDVQWASTPADGLDLMNEVSFSAVLVDQRLGSMTGLELIEKATVNGSTPPMIVLTGFNDWEIDRKAANAGAADYLVKDQITAEALERSIRYAISQHEALRALEETQQELERQMESKNEFLATVSHELRNPLTAVIGLAEMLHDPDQSLNSEQRAKLINTIVGSGFDVVNLVEDLLTAARQEAGKLSVVAVPVNLAAQVNQAKETLKEQLEIEVTGTAPRALADPGRVRQIVRNLLTNAIKYGEGEISVELGHQESRASLVVIDNGLGVPSQMEQAIFDRYTRAHRGDHVGSVGIGLAISRELALLMGGDLVYRRDGNHTRFELTLPVHD